MRLLKLLRQLLSRKTFSEYFQVIGQERIDAGKRIMAEHPPQTIAYASGQSALAWGELFQALSKAIAGDR